MSEWHLPDAEIRFVLRKKWWNRWQDPKHKRKQRCVPAIRLPVHTVPLAASLSLSQPHWFYEGIQGEASEAKLSPEWGRLYAGQTGQSQFRAARQITSGYLRW